MQKIPTQVWVLLVRRADIPYLNRNLAGLTMFERHIREALQWNIRQVFFWLEPPQMPYDQALAIEFERLKHQLGRSIDPHFVRTIGSLSELTIHEAERALSAPHLSLFSRQWMSDWSLSLVEDFKDNSSFESVWERLSALPEMDEWKEAKNPTVFFVHLQNERSWAWAHKRLGIEIVELSRSGFVGKNFNRKVSLFISRFLVQFEFSPTVWTWVNLAFGLLAGFLVLSPDVWTRVAGALVFYWSCIFDGVDGEVARFRYETSEAGALLDISVSWINTLFFYGALLVGLVNAKLLDPMQAQITLLAGATMLIGLSVYFSHMMKVPMGQGAWSTFDEKRGHTLRWPWMTILFRKESFAILTCLCILLRLPGLLVWGFVFGMVLALGILSLSEWKFHHEAQSTLEESEGNV